MKVVSSNIEKMSVETIVPKLLDGEININELNLHKSVQREAFENAVRERPNLLLNVAKENEAHFFKYALEMDPKYFIYLKREQYTDEFAQIYIKKRFDFFSSDSFVVRESLDNRIVFNYSYSTDEGDELYYYDSELKVPLSMKSSFKITLKLIDSIKLINKLDTNVTQLGADTVYVAVTDLVNNYYKEYINLYIKENKVGYYSLCTSFDEIGRGFVRELNGEMKEYGLYATDFKLGNLAIPKDIQHKIEDQAFVLRRRKEDVQAEAEMARLSLDSYEAKLAIQQKYPDADHSLTEFEKDLALKRYLIKNNRAKNEDIDRDIDISSARVASDVSLSKKKDTVPEIEPKGNGNAGKIALTLLIGFIFTTIGFALAPAMGAIALIATVVAICVVASSSSRSKIVTEASTPAQQDDSEDLDVVDMEESSSDNSEDNSN